MQFAEIIQRLGVELRLADLAPDDRGACAVMFDSVRVQFHEDAAGQAILMRADVGEVSLDDEEVLDELLAGNFFFDGVGGSALGVDADGAVWLTQRMSCADLAFPRFLLALERLVNLAEYWQRHLNGGDNTPPAESRRLDSMDHLRV